MRVATFLKRLRRRVGTLLPTSLFLLVATSFAGSYDIDALSRAAVQVRVADGAGSGTLLIRNDVPLVITSRHVVAWHYDAIIGVLVDVDAPAEPRFTARLRGFAGEHDFAVLELVEDLEGEPVSVARLRSGHYGFVLPELMLPSVDDAPGVVRRGDAVAVLGYPGIGDDDLVFTTGIVSAVQVGEFGDRRLPLAYRTNAEMSPGSSGGLALDARGRFIGIPTAVHTERRTGGRLGHLLPVALVQALWADEAALLTSWTDYVPRIGLDISAIAAFGDVRLGTADLGSPYAVVLVAGGDIDVADLGADCVGHVAAEPDFSLELTTTAERLLIGFVADSPFEDATLVVRTPGGGWLCNDDADEDTLNPALMIADAESGRYAIWVGGYDADDYIAGLLTVSDRDSLANLGTVSRPGPGFDLGGEPHFGVVALATGFVPDPHVVAMTAGGGVNVSAQRLGTKCAGFAARAPDVRLRWSGSTSLLGLYFVATAAADATLVVNDPNGSWHCNDDAHAATLNPALSWTDPIAGVYDIWVGSFVPGQFIEGELRVTEEPFTVP